jgi:HD-GYP domain-containing protein (c-di-GMP phosphodiesterase class II)
LHDIGKIYIRESILSKPGLLDNDEWQEMRQHPVIGADLVRSVPYLSGALPIIRSHHERWDGLGYPDGISGEEIPLGARIVAVVDCYDAMTTDRVYHSASSHDDAILEIIDGRGTRYDPDVVDAFLDVRDQLSP